MVRVQASSEDSLCGMLKVLPFSCLTVPDARPFGIAQEAVVAGDVRNKYRSACDRVLVRLVHVSYMISED